jgi:hypothetical protein
VTSPQQPIVSPRLPKDAIQKLIFQCTVTDWAPQGWRVLWAVDPLPMEGLRNNAMGAYIELSINSYRSNGVDDYRQAFNATTGLLQSVYYGLRQFTLTVDCRSFAPHIPAWDILESIRIRMNNPRSVTANAVFQATGLSWIRTHPTISLNYAEKGDVDNRMIWRQTMDIEFSWLSYAQVQDDLGYTIETVGSVPSDSPPGTNDVTGTLFNPDGNPWPEP